MSAPRPQRPAPGARRAAPRPGGGGDGSRADGTERVRPEFVPAPKKGAPPALTIGLLVLIVASAGMFGWAMMRKNRIESQGPTVVETTNQGEWNAILRRIRDAEDRYRETMAMRHDEDRYEEFQAKIEETMDFIGGIQEEIDLMLEDVRDPVTDELPPEYEGYNHQSRMLVVWLKDLSSVAGFGVGMPDDDSGD